MALSEHQRAVHDSFWRFAVDGEPCGTRAIADHLDASRGSVDSALKRLRTLDLVPNRPSGAKNSPSEWVKPEFLSQYPMAMKALNPPKREFESDMLPEDIPPIADLLARKEREYKQRQKAFAARDEITIRVKVDGPIGIMHMGDPHLDDNGCDIRQLQEDIETVKNTAGLFGANVGDYHNNWIGRLMELYAHQNTTINEAWALVEWLIMEIEWLYLIGGNHDAWSGGGDPLNWIKRGAKTGVFEQWGARMKLVFPNKREIFINARHTFRGNSRMNTNHGLDRAVMEGWSDHILVAGHTHSSGYSILKDPLTGRICHTLRVAGYKRFDSYAKKENFNNQNVSPSFTTIIDPQYADDDPRCISMIVSPQEAAEFLTYKRSKK